MYNEADITHLSLSAMFSSLQKSDGRDNDGRWVETEDGMEWVPAEDPEDVISGSQESVRSVASSKNPESTLTAEERNEMKESNANVCKPI